MYVCNAFLLILIVYTMYCLSLSLSLTFEVFLADYFEMAIINLPNLDISGTLFHLVTYNLNFKDLHGLKNTSPGQAAKNPRNESNNQTGFK